MIKPKFDVYLGDDGITVVHVDTPHFPENKKGPKIRIYLNDEVIFENPKLKEKNV